jgi:uncharacterized repeat protein (TIGR01451 family)
MPGRLTGRLAGNGLRAIVIDRSSRDIRFRVFAGLTLLCLSATLVRTNPRAWAAPGGHTPAQVGAATAAGVAYIDTQQNADGSFGTDFPEAETGAALLAYGVLANGNFASLPAAYQTHVKSAITWLLGRQNASAPSVGGVGGSWSGDSATYDTGLVLSGLSAFSTVDAGIPAAITNGRAYLVDSFQAPPMETCSSADPPDATANFCGGWNYDEGSGRSDESNTGFALTGLQLSGGVPAAVASVNLGWQHHIQEISSNSLASRNDGGGDYTPGESGSFSSNANDTGSMLFGLGFDGASAADPHVQAGLKLGNDVLDVYELAAPANHTMVYHDGATEDGACLPGGGTCDWNFATGEGGFHYSLFALTKGMGEFIAPSLTDATNWYAKVVDLLLNEQGSNGSWPPDLRDDASQVFATALSVSALGLVAVPPPPPADIVVTKTADADPVNAGAGDGYTVKLHDSTSAATVDSITDTLPAGFSYVANSTTGGITANPTVAGSQLTWTGPFALAAGADLQFHFDVTVSATAGHYTNTVTASAGAATVTPATNTAPIDVAIVVGIPALPVAGIPIALVVVAIVALIWVRRRGRAQAPTA